MTTTCPAAPEHPTWCNMRHQAGADPRRQQHQGVWKAQHRSNELKVTSYPSDGGEHSAVGVHLSFFGMHGSEVRGYYDTRDVRSLAAALLDLADAAERITR